MRRRQLVSQQINSPVKKETLKEKWYAISKKKGKCIICGFKYKTGIFIHFEACWNRINEYLPANEN